MTGPAVAGDGSLLSPADDLPVHQVAETIAVVGTSDRHFYDRYYFCAHHCDGSVAVVAGLGQYPNLGVTDAFLAVTWDGRQEVLRASRQLDADRLDLRVGPLGLDVVEGLRQLRLAVEPNPTGIEADLRWSSRTPAYLEPRHVNRNGPRLTTDSVRFCQTGAWSGHLAVDGRLWSLDDSSWLGVRDRSWGIRPVGEPEAPGRRYGHGPAGFLWLYAVIDFADRALVAIVQEDAAGRRTMDHAALVHADGSVEQLGSVAHDLDFGPASREITAARLHFDGGLEVELVPMTASRLALGTGYGTDPDWRHGMFQGPSVLQRRSFDLADEDARGGTYGLTDSLAAARMGTATGYGLFEYAVLGPNQRYGFGGRSRPDT